jgi:hypothetical protein
MIWLYIHDEGISFYLVLIYKGYNQSVHVYGDDMVINGIMILIYWLVVWNMNGLRLCHSVGNIFSRLTDSYFSEG